MYKKGYKCQCKHKIRKNNLCKVNCSEDFGITLDQIKTAHDETFEVNYSLDLVHYKSKIFAYI